MSINFNLPQRFYNWKFNPFLYKDKPFCDYITNKISDFLLFNDNGEVSDSSLWELFKVVVRGYIISYQLSSKRAEAKHLAEVEMALSRLEDAYRTTNSDDMFNSILKLKVDYNHALGVKVGNYIHKLKHKQFELGDKADILLARQLKGLQADGAIHKIASSTGQLLTDHKLINERFLEFYKQLYTSQSNPSDADLESFLDSLYIPVLPDAAVTELDTDFSLDEIKTAI